MSIRVKPGEKIYRLDGIIESGNTSIDTSALTGESLPRDITIGDEVPAGAINISGVITLKTTRRFTDSTVYKMLQMVESAVEKKTKTENFISVFAKYYTPIVVLAAVIISLIPPRSPALISERGYKEVLSSSASPARAHWLFP